ncbi:LLM class oxidoreductase [Aliamphritea hakodatensis]|uniref:LLM class oxidoreductase n=1 Tax=Aliamphritea hakodatensis TaxID=2895352 RepID=UPI0022FD9A81|nr:LLM class oxidoreductase [Aliamphritea hakodatensis]
MTGFNAGYQRMFKPGKLTLGLFMPLEAYSGDIPVMSEQESLAALAEDYNFSALWFRDVPLRDPAFGDVGQIFDVWVYLAWMAAHTRKIALATGSVVLPLRHPLHVAKAAASVDKLSGGRLVLGLASGDRPVEFPAFGIERGHRGELFRAYFQGVRQALTDDFPHFEASYGRLNGTADTLPKPESRVPMLVTGNSQQSPGWIAEQADGWITYPRSSAQQEQLVRGWNRSVAERGQAPFKPFAQSLYIDLSDKPAEKASPIHLGFRSGRNELLHFLLKLEQIGVSHVVINLKYGRRPAADVIQELGEEMLPLLSGGDDD